MAIVLLPILFIILLAVTIFAITGLLCAVDLLCMIWHDLTHL